MFCKLLSVLCGFDLFCSVLQNVFLQYNNLFVELFPELTVRNFAGATTTPKIVKNFKTWSSSAYTSSCHFYPYRVCVDCYQTRTTTEGSRRSSQVPKKQSLSSSQYYMYWVSLLCFSKKHHHQNNNIKNTVAETALLCHHFPSYFSSSGQKRTKACVFNCRIQFWNAEKLPEDNNSLRTDSFILCLLGYVLNWCKWLSQASTELILGLPVSRQQGSWISCSCHGLLHFVAEKEQACTSLLFCMLLPETILSFFPVKPTLWLSGGSEAELSVDGKCEMSGPSWRTVLQIMASRQPQEQISDRAMEGWRSLGVPFLFG